MQIAAGAPIPVNLRLEIPVAVEDLNPLVSRIGHVNVPLRIERDPAHRIELALHRAARSPGLDELAVLVELRHARIAEAIGYVDVARRVPRHVRRARKDVALLPRASRSAAASRRWRRGGRAGTVSASDFPAQQQLHSPVRDRT